MNAIKVGLVGVALILLPFAGYGVEYNPPIDLGSFGLGEEEAQAFSLNNAGEIVGCSGSPHGTLPFLWTADNGMQGFGSSDWMAVHSINDKGQIVGWGWQGAYLYEEGQVKGLGTIRTSEERAYDINNRGKAVGITGGTGGYPAIFEVDAVNEIPALLGYQGAARAINDSGQIVGWYSGGGGSRAFLVDGEVAKDLGTMGGQRSYAYDINNAGQVVGSVERSNGHVAFVYENGEMHDLGSGIAWAINDATQIVGDSATALNHVVLWTAARERIDVHPEGWQSSYAGSINNRGWIVGYGKLPDNRTRAFLLVPVGERMLSLKMMAEGFSMAWQTLEDYPHQLEASEDLQTWVPFGEPVSPVRSIVRFLDPDAPGLSHRFYRLELPTP